ncbi:uncharacterized protein [Nerophis lumbriciformis]|uniref:uncharacterized protein n=1 Tax=Nerophis lumbriciformis TaxID=546530 RepID=UPI002ADF7846|nr:uncharacterized protein LOC133607960 [Nerophis lumbriciformis]
MEDESMLQVDSILEAVKKHFSQISTAQWNLLVSGTPDSETRAILVDTISEVVQRLSSEVVKRLLPALNEHLRGQSSQAQVSRAIDRCSPKMSECITETFAAALDLPPQKYEGAGELTTLVESEVKHRVTSALTVAQSATEWPSEPTLFIRSSMSSVGALTSIFRQAVEYLKQVFARACTPCVTLCGRSALKNSEMTEAVSGILLKWSTASQGETTTETEDPVTVESAQLTAEDITKSIIQESTPASGDTTDRVESRISRFNLNMKLISNKVKNFFKSQEKPGVDGQVKLRRFRFLKFARMQFARMLGGLKRAFKNQDACLVFLKSERRDEKSMLSPKGDVKGAFRTSTLHASPSQRPVFEFEAIQEKVLKMFEDLGRMAPEAREEKIKRYMDEKLKGFSEELTSQLYEYIMSSHSEVYEVPSSRADTPFMDSVLWGRRGKKHWDGQIFSPEVLYAMTEDAAWRFLQQLVFWMETEPLTEAAYADEVSGAVSEINQLVVSSLHTGEVAEKVPPVKVQRLPVISTIETSEEDKNLTTASATSSSSPSQTLIPRQHTSSSDVPSFQDLTPLLAYTLTAQLGQRLPRKCKKSLKTDALLLVMDHLSTRAMKEISPDHIEKIHTMAHLEEVVTALVKKLLVDFGSPDKLVEALMADEVSFNDAVIRHLKIHLDELKESPQDNFLSKVCCYPYR